MQIPDFKNQELLTTALTHRSALNEQSSTSRESNERLEFLGDAVLELATTKFLFNQFPDVQEGLLTAYRSALVKTETLAKVARMLNLGEKLFMSKGEEATGGRDNDSLLADSMESVIGALYIDQGFEAAEKLLQEVLFTEFEVILQNKLYRDSKSHLQEVIQAKGQRTPKYEVVSEIGPDHDKSFSVNVLIDHQVLATGSGSSKQRAQQAAAQAALDKLSAE
jgi:ribonuclease-3